MAVKNSTILAKAWLEGTSDFQQRISSPTVAGIDKTIRDLQSPMNGQYFNQFMDAMVNKIGFSIARGKRYDNPLATVFKGQGDVPSYLNYGSTIEEVIPHWIQGHTYTDDVETLLKMHRPEVDVYYHTQNRKMRYPISVTRDEMRAAFHDEYGLNRLIARIMDLPINADNYDEYRTMLALFGYYDDRWGYFKKVIDAPTTKDAAENLLTEIMADAERWTIAPSTLYNNADVPVFARKDEIIFITTPDIKANLNVKTYAAMFNVQYAELPYLIATVDELPIANCLGILTTREHLIGFDTLYENTTFYNPESLTNQYYLHHWEGLSLSTYAPAICYVSSGTATTVPTIQQTVASLSVTPTAETVELGGTVALTVKLNGSITNGDNNAVAVRPDAATYTVAAAKPASGDVAAVPRTLNARTYVDNFGVLHVQKTGLEKGDVITVTATSSYVNPSGDTPDDLTATANVTIA